MTHRGATRLLTGVALLVAALLAACGEGGERTTPPDTGKLSAPVATATPTAAATPAGGAQASRQQVLSWLLPQTLALTGGQPGQGTLSQSAAPADSSLEGALLRQEDLPAGYRQVAAISTTLSLPQGSAQLAGRAYATDDGRNGSGSAVASLAAQLPPDATAQVRRELEGDPAAEVEQALRGTVPIIQVERLDASGLGEESVGLRLRLTPPSQGGGGRTVVEEVYLWLRDQRLYMLIALHTDGTAPLNARALAGLMDRRAQQQ